MVMVNGISGIFSNIIRNAMSALLKKKFHFVSESSENWIELSTPPVYKRFKTKGGVPNVQERYLLFVEINYSEKLNSKL